MWESKYEISTAKRRTEVETDSLNAYGVSYRMFLLLYSHIINRPG